MTQPRLIMRFFIDQCVPDSAGKTLAQRGHEVIFLRQKIAVDTPDPLVAAVSEANQAILVSHDNDFRHLVQRTGVAKRRFTALSRLSLRCRESQSAARLASALELIEFEWERCQISADKRLFIEIGDSYIRTHR